MSAPAILILSRSEAGERLAEAIAPLAAAVHRHRSLDEAPMDGLCAFSLIAIDTTGGHHGAVDWIGEARARGFREDVLALVDRDDTLNAVLALEVGADAILEMPAHPRVACAYARRVLRPRRTESLHLRVGPLEMNLGARRARVHGRDLYLPDSEFDLLACLARRAGEPLDREALLEGAPTTAPAPGRVIDSRICRLRGKLSRAGGPAVVTLRGRGYLLSDSAEAAAA